MAVFAHVVDTGSFSGAAKSLGISKSAVSKRVAELERGLGVTLLHRSTRQLSLTDVGRVYYDSCARVVAEAAQIEHRVSELQRKPLGTLRVNAPVQFGGESVTPAVVEFMREYPEVQVELTLQDELVNLIEDGIDVAIRVGRLSDSSLIARKLVSANAVICGAPSYLETHGTPRDHRELGEHEITVYTNIGVPNRVTLIRNQRRYSVTLRGRLQTNSGIAVRRAVVAGHGLAVLPRFYVEDDICDGRLVPVLADYRLPSSAVYAVYPAAQQVSPKVRLFVDFLVDRLGAP